MKKSKKENLEFYLPYTGKSVELPLFTAGVSAGFPSPADDFIERKLDLNEYLIKNHTATFFVKVNGNSMINAGIMDGDILIVDRSIEAGNNKIVIGIINGEFTVKRISRKNNRLYLMPENPDYKPVEINETTDFKIWGVVTYAIHKLI